MLKCRAKNKENLICWLLHNFFVYFVSRLPGRLMQRRYLLADVVVFR